jgi:glycogen synthase
VPPGWWKRKNTKETERPESLRIVHVSPSQWSHLGGGSVYLREISAGLVSRGHQVTVVTPGSHRNLGAMDGELPAIEAINGVKIVRFRPDGGVLGGAVRRWQHLRGGPRSLRALLGDDGFEVVARHPSMLQLVPYLAVVDADVVASLLWLFPAAYYAFLARRIRRFTLVGIPFFHTAEEWSRRPRYTRMLGSCDAVIVNTTHERDFVLNQARTRVELIGAGIHPAAFARRNGQEIRDRYGLGRSPVVGFVGRQAREKGVVALLEAMKIVWKWNSDVRLVLAGVCPPDRNERDVAIETLPDADKRRIIRIDGFQEAEKASLYDAFDVFVLPSVSESFGIAYLEAWMCDKPVIGARIGGTQCVIREGVDGLLADPESPADIADGIVTLLADPLRRQAMGSNGRAKTLAEFTWDRVLDKVEGLYRDLAGVSQLGLDRSVSPKPT